MTERSVPPPHVIARAQQIAARRPAGSCTKSLRGAVVFDAHTGMIHGWGTNGPPSPFGCTGSDHCRKVCRRICVHAEAQAIDATLRAIDVRIFTEDRRELHLVHVKLGVDGLTPSGPPSCADCSKLILGCRFISGVWLFEAIGSSAAGTWCLYSAEDFHRRALQAEGLTEPVRAKL